MKYCFKDRLIASFFLIFTAGLAQADSIVLKNGDRFSGKVVSYAQNICVFDTNYGAAIKIPATDIQSISTDENYNVEFTNGDKAIGKLGVDENNQTLLDTLNFGKVAVRVASINRMTKYFARDTGVIVSGSAPDSTKEEGFGTDTTKQAPLDFLIGSTVLLSPGEYEFDLGISYKQSRTQYNLPDAGYFQKSSYSARQLELRSTLRAGLFEGVEGYLSVPVTYSSVEDISSNEYTRSSDAWHLADIAFGGQYQLKSETESFPAVSMTFDIHAPTGKKKYNNLVDSWKDPLNNGSGHWSVAPGLAFVRTTDPGMLFGGMSYQYFLPATIDGYRIQPGWVINSYVGIGFALNESLSVGTRLSYAYSSNMKADGEIIHGSDSDPMDLSFNASYRLSNKWVVSPSVSFGLSNDSGPAALSLNLKRQIN